VAQFTTVSNKAVAMLPPDIDTDIIAPLDSLTTEKSVADVAFTALRYIDGDSKTKIPNPDFWLNQPANKSAKIMLTGENFGCGSSRVTAAQSFKDLGFRCLIGSSFGDIFFDNCFQHGLLVCILPVKIVEHLATQIGAGDFHINLKLEHIKTPTGNFVPFKVDSWRRKSLLKGLEPIKLGLPYRDKIKKLQHQDKIQRLWVYNSEVSM